MIAFVQRLIRWWRYDSTDDPAVQALRNYRRAALASTRQARRTRNAIANRLADREGT